ncbi:MAG: DUF433 domain-containing protein [Dehalococcoidia bacterium]
MTVLALPQIVSTPDTLHGAPRIDGHRIAVADIAVRCVHQGRTVEDVAEAYQISPSKVHAALAYYWDHREEIDAELEAEQGIAEEIRAREGSRLPSRLPRR